MYFVIGFISGIITGLILIYIKRKSKIKGVKYE